MVGWVRKEGMEGGEKGGEKVTECVCVGCRWCAGGGKDDRDDRDKIREKGMCEGEETNSEFKKRVMDKNVWE